MWLCWVVLMASIVSSSRYFRHYWRNSHFIHACIGVSVFVITTLGVTAAWIRLGGPTFEKWSSICENIATLLVWILSIAGMAAYYKRRYGNYPWGTTSVLNLINFHKWFGRIFCVGVQGLIIFAIIDNFGFNPTWITVSAAQFIGLVLVFTVLELRHQSILSKE